jgi:methyl halide transferase
MLQVKEANSYVEAHLDTDRISSAHVVGGDFFEWTDGDKPFDVGFDYTFFCALSPHMRAKWGPAWHRLLRPGGLLVTLIFPVDEDQNRQGPPWPVTPEMYKEALEPYGFTLRSLEKVPNELSHKGRGGREYLAVWERQE